jgi:sporulation protein YqfC
MKRIKSYLNDTDFKLNITNKIIHIDNIQSISKLEDNIISLNFEDFKLTIEGTNFTIKKLIEREILFTGIIKNIKFEK